MQQEQNLKKWIELTYKLAFFIVLAVVVMEIGISAFLFFKGSIEQRYLSYFLEFLIIPVALYCGALLVIILSRKKISDPERLKYVYIFSIIGIMTVVSATHRVFSVTIFSNIVPLVIAILYSNPKFIKTVIEVDFLCVLCEFGYKEIMDYIDHKHSDSILAEIVITITIFGFTSFIAYKVTTLLKAQKDELERMNEESLRAKEKADLANNAKSKFLTNVSREIRTPINAILGMNEMIAKEADSESIKGYACDVKIAADNLRNIINDILDISRIEAGNMEIISREYELSEMVEDLYKVFFEKAKSCGIDFLLCVDKSLPKTLIGDNVRIKQVLSNLLSNAIKFTPRGSVKLSIVGRTEGKNVILAYSVEDTGIGIKQEDIPDSRKFFEGTDEKMGLGLIISTHLLELMGSSLNVRAIYGKGSIFSFEIRQEIVDRSEMRLHDGIGVFYV